MLATNRPMAPIKRTWHGSTRGSYLEALKGDGFAEPTRDNFENPPGLLRVEPHSNGSRERSLVGRRGPAGPPMGAEQGMNLMSSTLLSETRACHSPTAAEQIERFRTPGPIRVTRVRLASRSVAVSFQSSATLTARILDTRGIAGPNRLHRRRIARFGKTYAAPPEQLIAQLANDEAIASADTLLLTIPNQLGVDYCAHVLETLLSEVAPTLGWR